MSRSSRDARVVQPAARARGALPTPETEQSQKDPRSKRISALLPSWPAGRWLALSTLSALCIGLALGATAGSSELGLHVPPATAGSLGDAVEILTNNLEPWALLVVAVLLQPLGVPGLSPGFLPGWLTDLAVGFALAFNLLIVGGVLGALGLPALARVLPHAPFELSGFAILVVAYLRARRGDLSRYEALSAFALSALLLAAGAGIESFVSGGIG